MTDASERASAAFEADRWRTRLTELARRHDVPGAVLGIHQGDARPVLAGTGVLNTTTGVEVTADSVFQIGSVTKIWTATLVARLIEDGLIDLDAPVRALLPELRLSQPELTERVTMRHLLTHTSGIDGDVFTDTGRGEECLERYVHRLVDVPALHAPGATFSYCNAGYVLAGRVVEKVTGRVWDDALRHWLFEPLGLTHTVTIAEEAHRFRAAMGHLPGPGGRPVPAPVWDMPRSCGPAGLIKTSVGDVLTFAACHLRGGTTGDGTRILTEATTEAMARRQVTVPDASGTIDSWGLGWSRYRWQNRTVIGHDGATVGQSAYLRLLPELGLAVALVANGGHATELHRELLTEVLSELAGIAVPPAPAPAPNAAEAAAVDLTPWLGRYERASLRLEVLQSAAGPRVRQMVTGPLAALTPDPVQQTALVPENDALGFFRLPGAREWTPISFYALPTGERFAHVGARALPRTES